MAVPPGLVTMSFKRPGMLAGFEQQLGRAVDRLRGQEQRRLAVQADLHPAVGERFDDQHDVRRAAARKTGHRVEQRSRRAPRPCRSLRRAGARRRGRLPTRAFRARSPWRRRARWPPCSAWCESRARRAGAVASMRLDGNARGDGDDERVWAKATCAMGTDHLVDHLRLDREHDRRRPTRRAWRCLWWWRCRARWRARPAALRARRSPESGRGHRAGVEQAL